MGGLRDGPLPGTLECGSALLTLGSYNMNILIIIAVIGAPFWLWSIWAAYTIGHQVGGVLANYRRDYEIPVINLQDLRAKP